MYAQVDNIPIDAENVAHATTPSSAVIGMESDDEFKADLEAICAPDFAATVWVVRHGERIDQINPSWIATAQNPYDPPLTETGIAQATRCGTSILSDISSTPQKTTLTHILSSPFYRTLQTSRALLTGLSQTPHHTQLPPLSLEPGLSEWLSEKYFPSPLPLEPFTQNNRSFQFRELPYTTGSYSPSLTTPLPPYPEPRPQMRARLLRTFASSTRQLCSPPPSPSVTPGIILVSHGAGCTALVEEVMRAVGDDPSFTVEATPYCCISRLEKRKGESRWRCPRVADVGHLGELLERTGLEFVVGDGAGDEKPVGGGEGPSGKE
ncbi:hypothetical protein HDV00_009620 [Rhizophlyctis rosea]|nr:hypothetical protein HDV00_009620 [Rhizophlyctis rosea]